MGGSGVVLSAAAGQRGRFEAGILTRRKKLKFLMDGAGKWTLDTTRLARRARRLRRRQGFACAASQGWIDGAGRRRWLEKLILDLDSSVSESCGRREGSGSAAT
jgi:hypothetical protein